MGERRQARQRARIAADRLGGDVERPVLVIGNPFRGQRLAVPRDVRLGDTPEGEPAVLWKVPDWVQREDGTPVYGCVDWASGGLADQAIWAFLELAVESDPERFVAFARRFGTLGLWPYRTGQRNEKGQKIRIFELTDREGRDLWVPSIPEGIFTPPRYFGTMPYHEMLRLKESGLLTMLYEPISEWRRWALQLGAVLEISQALRLGDVGTPEQWAPLGITFELYTELNYARDTDRQRRQIATHIQRWFLKWSGLTPVIRWNGKHPSVELALGGDDAVKMPRHSMQGDWPENSLFPALVGSFLSIVVAGRPIGLCHMCGKTYPSLRLPRPDQPAYCDFCHPESIKANKRRWAAEHRAKKRRERAEQQSVIDDNSG